jgi:hypothetical protein
MLCQEVSTDGLVGTGEERTSRGLDPSDQIRTVQHPGVPKAERDGVLLYLVGYSRTVP